MSPIVTTPNAVLRQVAKPVTELNKRVLDIIKDMENTLKAAKNPEGVGLAAPQIGISLRIFLIRPDPKGPITTLINPEITKYSLRRQSADKKDGVFEGCLSIPHHYSPVIRSMSVTVKYFIPKKLDASNYTLDARQFVFSGFPAHVVQHEMDHLNGILFIDRVLEQNVPLYQVEGKTWTQLTI
jgi:peptide deformylase